MIVAISQPRYLPFLGYFHRIAASDLFVYLDTVQYTPRDWENRNRIKTDRDALWLTVPVHHEYLAMIQDVRIDQTRGWQKNHWKTLKQYYRRAPHFDWLAERLAPLYLDGQWERLLDLNLALTATLLGCFGLEGKALQRASELGPFEERGSNLIRAICEATGADAYLSGPEGVNYLQPEDFEQRGIRIVYQTYQHPVYDQLHGDFLPYMATIDLLFNHGPASYDILMRGQQTIL